MTYTLLETIPFVMTILTFQAFCLQVINVTWYLFWLRWGIIQNLGANISLQVLVQHSN